MVYLPINICFANGISIQVKFRRGLTSNTPNKPFCTLQSIWKWNEIGTLSVEKLLLIKFAILNLEMQNYKEQWQCIPNTRVQCLFIRKTLPNHLDLRNPLRLFNQNGFNTDPFQLQCLVLFVMLFVQEIPSISSCSKQNVPNSWIFRKINFYILKHEFLLTHSSHPCNVMMKINICCGLCAYSINN